MQDMNILEDEKMILERYEMAMDRIAEVKTDATVILPYRDFFERTAEFLLLIREFLEKKEEIAGGSLELQKQWNQKLYADILPEHYDTSYGNPAYAGRMLGETYGPVLSAVYAEIRGAVVYAFEDRMWDITVLCELFLEIYNDFEEEEIPSAESVKKIFYWYVSDYSEEFSDQRIRAMLDPSCDFAAKIIMGSDLNDLRYLYRFGEYISENELKMAAFLNTLSREEIDAMARTYTEGYRIGFVNGGKDIAKKKVVNIRYNLGFERMIRAAVIQFEAMGLQPTIYRYATHLFNKKQHIRIGYTGAVPNKQYDYDHRGDDALLLDDDFVQRKLRVMQNTYENYKELAAVHGGPAVVEIFGEKPFVPETKPEALTLSENQQKRKVAMGNQEGQITNRYIKGEERSFTIIAYPIPEIGAQFEDIFKDTVKINTLDYKKYEKIQQTIINALDKGTAVRIKGSGENRTDLTVCLQELKNPEKETIFENCVADVNIPVGEVFTSPKLTGTNGVLHVSQVYLNELQYRDLCITFRDGKTAEYSCSNFDSEEENKKYVLENVLYHRPWLPLGEFAVGTNTTAYVVARKYKIQDKMPILIAEKMGPHFAVGDTCYSWQEDTPVYNQDGKEIIARDNEVSILRKTDLDQAYFGCHTDITIPYEELEYIKILHKDGTEVPIIEDGRFVLPGTEELNTPLEEEKTWQK